MKWASCLLFVASVATALPKDRNAKAFSLFSVVSFPNDECATAMAGMIGLCLTAEECEDRAGGTASGNCASGFGVCCLTTVEATAANANPMITNSLTYIQNENFPQSVGNPNTGAAAFMFPMISGTDVEQIRLDFETAVFQQPTMPAGVCNDGAGDFLQVTGPPTIQPFLSGLCGTFSGQHMYIDSGRRATGATLTISLSAAALDRSWKILVRFIPVGSDDRAPPNCMQFYTANSGRITSFNHEVNNAQGTLLADQIYQVCIRLNPGFQSVVYRETRSGGAASPDAFRLEGATNAGESQVGAGCTQEGLLILGTNTPVPVYCGDSFHHSTAQTNSAPVTSTAKQPGFFVVSILANRAAGTSG